jgi:hypothetical protein
MADTKAKDKDLEDLRIPTALPVGHPAAGYVSPDLSFHEGRGTLPDEEKEWHEKRNKAREEEVEKVEEQEPEAAKQEAIARKEQAEESRKARVEEGAMMLSALAGSVVGPAPSKSSSSSSSSSSSKSSA